LGKEKGYYGGREGALGKRTRRKDGENKDRRNDAWGGRGRRERTLGEGKGKKKGY
jgi:hypothetical protein